ncbi:MAG TPA: hypothetical protein VH796_01880 [Nitrososphaeraceae archaeon]|jgi:hypothetical protein
MDSDNTLNQHKDFSVIRIKKKIHRISDKSLTIIDESLVKQLSIDENSWCTQEQVSDGILLKIYRSTPGDQLPNPITEQR